MVQHHNPVRDVPDHFHVVLDDHDGETPLGAQPTNHLGQLDGLDGVHTGHRLIEQQHARLGGHRPGDLQATPVRVRQGESRLVHPVADETVPEEAEYLLGPFPDLSFFFLEGLGLEQRPDE